MRGGEGILATARPAIRQTGAAALPNGEDPSPRSAPTITPCRDHNPVSIQSTCHTHVTLGARFPLPLRRMANAMKKERLLSSMLSGSSGKRRVQLYCRADTVG